MLTPSTTDYYALLGIAPEAAPEEIAQRYRLLATVLQPDRFVLDPPLMEEAGRLQTELVEAWAVLADPARRAAYDAEQAAQQELREAPARAAERELQRLRVELARRDGELEEQRAAHAALEQRLAEVERKAAWDRAELAGLVTAAERKASRLQAKSEAEARASQNSRRGLLLWQIAAIVGIVNTFVLLWLLLS